MSRQLSEKDLAAIACLPADAKLNPLQLLFVDMVQTKLKDRPTVVCTAPTNSGKTRIINMLGHRVLARGFKILYVGISRALAEQKWQEWKDPAHPWSRHNISIITGDYSFNKDREGELMAADVIIATPEALLSRMTKKANAMNRFLDKVRLFAFDEAHLVGADSRGDVMEVVMKLAAEHYSKAQLLLLSGTIINTEDFEAWMENAKPDTPVEVIKSDYVAVPVERYYVSVPTRQTYKENTEIRCDAVYRILCQRKESTLIPVFNKNFGNELKQYLNERHIVADFHNADLSKDDRQRIVDSYMSKKLKVLICTSGLIVGMDMPAENVILTAVKAGGGDLSVADILQALGRAGRTSFCDIGRQFVLLPTNQFAYHKKRIEEGEPILSSLVRIDRMALHLLHALYMDEVSSVPEFFLWYQTTLAYAQSDFEDEGMLKFFEVVAEELCKRRMAKLDEETGVLKATKLGKITAQMLLSPFHFSDIVRNFNRMGLKSGVTALDIAVAYGRAYDNKQDFYNPRDDPQISPEVAKAVGSSYYAPVQCIYNKIRGRAAPYSYVSLAAQLNSDVERTLSALCRVASETKALQSYDTRSLAEIFLRIKTGCTQEEAKHELQPFQPQEIARLLEKQIIGVSQVRRRKAVAVTVLKEARMAEIGASTTMSTMKTSYRRTR